MKVLFSFMKESWVVTRTMGILFHEVVQDPGCQKKAPFNTWFPRLLWGSCPFLASKGDESMHSCGRRFVSLVRAASEVSCERIHQEKKVQSKAVIHSPAKERGVV